ncbi:hypothetical protein Sango_2392300 [Sesamum angolense]|uniref:Reverse transcriptase zinc-binding domain-containing protein n=1 Tax=Sesamum angolense TaxID=2727404 RepID=A0AAE2BJN1_9LAMI|nr:hypothetical protein Sango_2392300 [Sesamum angolense]
MAAQDLFRAGCRWRVGKGLSSRVWSDPWLPRPRSFKPITPAPASMEYMRVSDFMDPHSHEWDVTKIRQFLRPIDSDLILGIPLSQTSEQDVLIWHYSRNGVFSVCSAYHLACSLDDRPCSSSLRHNEQVWWRKLWQMKLPCKVQVFIWRACLKPSRQLKLSQREKRFYWRCVEGGTRHCNVAAHALAKLASSFVEGGSVVSPAIAPIVYADIST